MRVLLDGQLIPIDRPTLAVAITAASRAAESSGRILISAKVDGLPLDETILQQPPDTFSDAKEVLVTSAAPSRIVGDMLAHAADALASIRASQQQAGKLFQVGDIQAAQPHLETIFSVWQAVAGGVQQGADMLSLDLATLRVPGDAGAPIEVGPQIENLVTKLRGLQAALQRQDWAAVADSLLFDLDRLTQDWAVMLRGLAAAISTEGSPS